MEDNKTRVSKVICPVHGDITGDSFSPDTNILTVSGKEFCIQCLADLIGVHVSEVKRVEGEQAGVMSVTYHKAHSAGIMGRLVHIFRKHHWHPYEHFDTNNQFDRFYCCLCYDKLSSSDGSEQA